VQVFELERHNWTRCLAQSNLQRSREEIMLRFYPESDGDTIRHHYVVDSKREQDPIPCSSRAEAYRKAKELNAKETEPYTLSKAMQEITQYWLNQFKKCTQ
jgi:hypothetical protein